MPSDFGSEALVREFLEEAEDHFHALDEDLLAMERALDAGRQPDAEIIEEMFRATHTLKGLSAMFDFVDLKTLAHAIESVFDGLRTAELTLDTPLLAVLFESVDALRTATESVLETGPRSEAALLAVRRLEAHLSAGQAAVERPLESSDDVSHLSELTQERIAELAVAGLSPVVIPLRWGIELRLGSFRREWLEEALGGGEILQIRPIEDDGLTIEQIDTDTADIVCEVVAVTDRTTDELAAVLGMRAELVRALRLSGVPESDARTAPAVSGGKENCESGKRVRHLRVDISRLDDLMDLAGELVTARTRLEQLSTELRERQRKDETTIALSGSVKEVSMLINNLQEQVMQMRMVPVGQLFSKFPRAVRDLAKSSGKHIRLVIIGEDTELDKRVIEQIEDPLLHILRNACDHGIETPEARAAAGKDPEGTIVLVAGHEGNSIVIEVTDDGCGLDLDAIRRKGVELGAVDEETTEDRLLELIMDPGFTTSSEVTDVSGRGVGLDVVAKRISELSGSVEVESDQGLGTSFRLRLPLTLAIIPSLLVESGGSMFAVPLASVAEVLRVDASTFDSVKGVPVLEQRGRTLPLAIVSALLGMGGAQARDGEKRLVVEVSGAGQRLGLLVDALAGQQEIVVKNLEQVVGRTKGIGGATILGDGSIVPILDCDELVKCAASASARASLDGVKEAKVSG